MFNHPFLWTVIMIIVEFYQRVFGFVTAKVLVDKSPVCIASACSSSYFGYLISCLIPSVAKYEPTTKFILFDLGLEEGQIAKVKEYLPHIEIRTFNFDRYPEYYKDLTSFAWMSVCMSELMIDDSLPDKIIWLDTRDVLVASLSPTRHLIRKYGFYLPYSRTTIGELTYPTTTKLFHELSGRMKAKDFENQRQLNTAIMGFSRSSSVCQEIIWQWLQLSKIKDFIQPEGSNRKNHRQDQSLLSLIYYSIFKRVPILAQNWYKVRLHQDSANL